MFQSSSSTHLWKCQVGGSQHQIQIRGCKCRVCSHKECSAREAKLSYDLPYFELIHHSRPDAADDCDHVWFVNFSAELKAPHYYNHVARVGCIESVSAGFHMQDLLSHNFWSSGIEDKFYRPLPIFWNCANIPQEFPYRPA